MLGLDKNENTDLQTRIETYYGMSLDKIECEIYDNLPETIARKKADALAQENVGLEPYLSSIEKSLESYRVYLSNKLKHSTDENSSRLSLQLKTISVCLYVMNYAYAYIPTVNDTFYGETNLYYAQRQITNNLNLPLEPTYHPDFSKRLDAIVEYFSRPEVQYVLKQTNGKFTGVFFIPMKEIFLQKMAKAVEEYSNYKMQNIQLRMGI